MDIFLQAWGGGLYLLNKILFSLAEGRSALLQRRLKIFGWTVYLLGVPAWVVILLGKQDWIAAAIEAGGVPSMLFGLYTVVKASTSPNGIFDRVARGFTHGFILLGVGYSLVDYGGITSLSQVLEMGVMAGFLMGSYLMAKNRTSGWLFFMVMNISMAALMGLQEKPLLAVQQMASLGFVVYGYVRSVRAAAPLWRG